MATIEHPERTLVIERVFDAPRTLVYDAWTDSEHIDKWWGPTMVTTRTIERDFSVGGSWKYVMEMPGSVSEHSVENKYTEIVPGEKIAWTEFAGGDTSNQVTVTLLFEDQGDETKLTMLIVHDSTEQMNMNEQGGMLMGWTMTLDSFVEFLAKQSAN
ncbi:MAG: SRPBCC domain-containing protein [Chloroflexi bacterium]|jgi:uncharacterized protein YndB with AHSA1/START domain|nr:SRPBCC domain-containing protein [Chloroflexota bacterium]